MPLCETFLGGKTRPLIRMQALVPLFGLFLCLFCLRLHPASLFVYVYTHLYCQRKLVEQQHTQKALCMRGVRLGETRANLHTLIQAARQRESAGLIMHCNKKKKKKETVSSYYASSSKGDTAGVQPQHSELNIEVCGERKSQSRLAARGPALPLTCCAALSQVACFT